MWASPDGSLHLYQVAWDINTTETLEREERTLHMAVHELGIPGTIITPENYFDVFLKLIKATTLSQLKQNLWAKRSFAKLVTLLQHTII